MTEVVIVTVVVVITLVVIVVAAVSVAAQFVTLMNTNEIGASVRRKLIKKRSSRNVCRKSYGNCKRRAVNILDIRSNDGSGKRRIINGNKLSYFNTASDIFESKSLSKKKRRSSVSL